MRRQVLRVLGLLLVAAGLAAENATAGESGLITPQAIQGMGEYSNSPSLIIDGQAPAEETAWNDNACVYWEKPQAGFVITLDAVHEITGLTIQADNNDDYVIETSMDGSAFSPLLVVLGDWGGVFSGVETLSTLADDSHFSSEMAIAPVQARYVRLSARNGDEAYSVSELSLYGSKVESGSVGPVVVTGGDPTTPVTAGTAIRPVSIRGAGEFSNAAGLILDGQMPPKETAWDDDRCVYWVEPQASFVLTLDGVYRITGLTIQADNNDDYVVEASVDGTTFTPLLTVLGDWGEVSTGMDTLSTLQDDPHFVPEMTLTPTPAKYIRLSARNGDEAYSVSELSLYGSKVESGSAGPVVVTGGGTTPSTAVGSLLKPQSIRGVGKYTRSEKLIIDGKMPEQGTKYNSRQCVHWSDPRTHFIIDLGQVQRINAVAMQVDSDDTYVLEVSADGEKYTPLVVVAAAWGEVTEGMETVSMLRDDPQYLPMMLFRPVDARYVSISARGGNKAYAVSEVLLYGGKKPEGTPPIQPPVGPVPPATTPVSVGGPGSMEDIFNAVDKNKDSRISKDEYAAIWKDKLDVDKNFAFFDKDNSGYIEKQEFLGLADGLKDLGIDRPDATGTTGTGSGQILRLDPIKTQKAIDALPRWAEIRSLIPQGKTAEVNEIVKEAGFESWLELNRYFSMIYSVGMTVMNNPDGARPYASKIGQEAVEIIVRPENLERIKANAPTPPSR